MTEFSMARPRSRFRRLCPPSVFASFLCRSSSWAGPPSFSSRLLGEAVIFAMLASYILSRTLVPTLAMYWLGGDHAKHNAPGGKNSPGAKARQSDPGNIWEHQSRVQPEV